jgi:thymidine phosphorylase
MPSPAPLVRAGEPLMTLLTDTPEKFERAKEALQNTPW